MSKNKPVAAAPVDAEPVAERVPMAEPEGGWPADEFTGLAGSFVRDPYTGLRRPADEPPAEETKPQADA